MPPRRRTHTPPLAVVLAVLLLAAALAAAADGPPHHADTHACGFDELEARTRGTRVSGISRVAPPPSSPRSIDAAATPAAGTANSWQPIRIRVFTEDLDDARRYCTREGEFKPDYKGSMVACAREQILSDTKKRVLRELLIPAAIQLHQDRLNVPRVEGRVIVDPSISGDTICGQFTVPTSHTTTGVSDADFVLYMSAGSTRGNTIAWATTCQHFGDTGRPSVGVSNVSPKYIAADPQTVRVIAHELLHALGFSITTFQSRGMVSTVDLRGKGASPVLISPNVVARTREQYGCPTQNFMELEDAGGAGTVNSHWKRRSAKDELMAGISGVGYYTALTIAAMEDTGFYTGNYANAEPMPYGRNAGCALATSKCDVNGVSQFAEMFCTNRSDVMVCTTDHHALGSCASEKHTTVFPPQFQYFSDPTYGGIDSLMDYCPTIQENDSTKCRTDAGSIFGSTYGVNSRCFDVPTGFESGGSRFPRQLGICADVQCGASTYSVKVMGAWSYTACTPGATLSLPGLSRSFSSGSLVCPSYDDVCVGRVNATEYEPFVNLPNNGVAASPAPTLALAAVLLLAGAVAA